MPSTRFHSRALLAALATSFVAMSILPAFAAPSPAGVGAGRERVEQAVQRLEDARQRRARIAEKLALSSERLDLIVAEQREGREQLASRVHAMYRSGDSSFVSVLLGAESFEDFASRWQLLAEVNRSDAEELEQLETSRARVRATAQELLSLQEESARSADAIERELASARKELAADEAALREYQARAAEKAAAARSSKLDEPKSDKSESAAPAAERQQKVAGKGAWKSAVASHYGINFSGRGASGKKIGPYSMMVAHKTLPFGTLVEFEYKGERAVARVEDRGPHVAGRDFDLGPGVARVLGFRGVEKVRWRVVGQ